MVYKEFIIWLNSYNINIWNKMCRSTYKTAISGAGPYGLTGRLWQLVSLTPVLLHLIATTRVIFPKDSIEKVTFLLENPQWHPNTYRKITLLTFKTSNYPLKSVPSPSFTLLTTQLPSFTTQMFSLTKFVHSRSAFMACSPL